MPASFESVLSTLQLRLKAHHLPDFSTLLVDIQLIRELNSKPIPAVARRSKVPLNIKPRPRIDDVRGQLRAQTHIADFNQLRPGNQAYLQATVQLTHQSAGAHHRISD